MKLFGQALREEYKRIANEIAADAVGRVFERQQVIRVEAFRAEPVRETSPWSSTELPASCSAAAKERVPAKPGRVYVVTSHAAIPVQSSPLDIWAATRDAIAILALQLSNVAPFYCRRVPAVPRYPLDAPEYSYAKAIDGEPPLEILIAVGSKIGRQYATANLSIAVELLEPKPTLLQVSKELVCV